MPEEVLFKNESKFDRATIAEYLRSVADSLELGAPISLQAGDQSVAINPLNRLGFEVKVEREGRPGEPGELSIEFELEWDEDAAGDSRDAGSELKIR